MNDPVHPGISFLTEHHCSDCRWYKYIKETTPPVMKSCGMTLPARGQCRRQRPISIQLCDGTVLDPHWPTVMGTDCCGDYETEWGDTEHGP